MFERYVVYEIKKESLTLNNILVEVKFKFFDNNFKTKKEAINALYKEGFYDINFTILEIITLL